MATISALEAKNRFGQVLDRVARGEEIIITKHDRPVARIVPEGRANQKSIANTFSKLRSLRERIERRRAGQPKITIAEIRSAIEEGRR
jgi:prevent-host-death family protein